jgi:hypothetical protein
MNTTCLLGKQEYSVQEMQKRKLENKMMEPTCQTEKMKRKKIHHIKEIKKFI